MSLFRIALMVLISITFLGIACAYYPYNTPVPDNQDLIFEVFSVAGVNCGNPPVPSTFTISEERPIVMIATYHWCDGEDPGTISLQEQDGTIYGPWQAIGRNGSGGAPNRYWEVVFADGLNLPAGTYTIVDSRPETWSWTEDVGNRGHSYVFALKEENDGLSAIGGQEETSSQPETTNTIIPEPSQIHGQHTGSSPGQMGDIAQGSEEKLYNYADAELMFQAGDIDNLGFGWPQGFDVFSGSSTPTHSYPWEPGADDPAGTDRIMVGTSYDGHSPAGQDGYVSTTRRPDNQPETIVIEFDPGELEVKSAIIQMFVDDFQSPLWKSKFQVEINEQRAPFLEEVLNSLVQTGPIGKLITVQIPDDFLGDVASGMLNIRIDDPTTGAGDGYAVDFVRLLINPKTMTNTGTVFGVVLEEKTDEPIGGAKASASGVITSSTDSDGKFILEEVPAGLVAVTVSKNGYVSQIKTIDLTSGGDAELDFQLQNEEETDGKAQKDESEIMNNWNIGSVDNNPTCSPFFTIFEPQMITYIDTYHWNYGSGTPSGGTITLRKDDGTEYGPWQVETESGQGGVLNAWWIAYPNEVIPAGTYTIIDSEPETWSKNSESEDCGFSKVLGVPEASEEVGKDAKNRQDEINDTNKIPAGAEESKNVIMMAAQALKKNDVKSFMKFFTNDTVTQVGDEFSIPPEDASKVAEALKNARVVEVYPLIVLYEMEIDERTYNFYTMWEGDEWKLNGF